MFRVLCLLLVSFGCWFVVAMVGLAVCLVVVLFAGCVCWFVLVIVVLFGLFWFDWCGFVIRCCLCWFVGLLACGFVIML